MYKRQPIDCPFKKAKELIEEIKKETKIIIIDFHAEATSEKIAMGWHVDGYASVIYGTHTHIQTADNKILPEGTGYITCLLYTSSYTDLIAITQKHFYIKSHSKKYWSEIKF